MTWWAWLLVSWPVASIAVGVLFGRLARVGGAERPPLVTDAEIEAFLESCTASADPVPMREIRTRPASSGEIRRRAPLTRPAGL